MRDAICSSRKTSIWSSLQNSTEFSPTTRLRQPKIEIVRGLQSICIENTKYIQNCQSRIGPSVGPLYGRPIRIMGVMADYEGYYF